MIKGLLVAVAVLAGSDFSQAAVKGGSSSCHWGFEVFKSQVSEACQKSLLSKLNEQDKIFAQRLFKEWEPLKGYDVQLEDGWMQFSNPKDDDFLEIQWISLEPAIAFINGVIVNDDSKDASIYRRVERMLKKADDTTVAMGLPSRLERFKYFLLSDEALAAVRQSVDDSVFIFTAAGWTGDAETIVDKVNLAQSGHLPAKRNFWESWDKVQCTDTNWGTGRKKVVSVQGNIQGQPVTIRSFPDSRTKFLVSGYPTNEAKLMVDFTGENAAAPYMQRTKLKPKYYWKKGKRYRRKYRGGQVAYLAPCSGLYNEELNPSCGKLWQELAGDERFQEVQKAIGRHEDSESIRWGQDISCAKVYPGNANVMIRYECEQRLGSAFQKENRRFQEGQAKITRCTQVGESVDDAKCKEKLKAGELPGEGPQIPENLRESKLGAMRAYADAWREDPKMAKLKPEAICPGLALSESEQRSNSYLPDCMEPPRGAGAKLKAVHKEMKKGEVYIDGKVRGALAQRDLEKQVLGAMILGECCNSASCIDKIGAKTNIKLENGKTAQ